ncbi:MAG: phenylalanine--tRNA ligase subunit beta [Candidatus Omnitrophota bacterium]
MKIPYKWLKEYVSTKESVKNLSSMLTMAGLEITSIETIDNDTVMDIEITSNRSDWLSITGVAREVAAISGAKFRIPELKLKYKAKKLSSFEVTVAAVKDCPRYSARLIQSVKVGSSPTWLALRLKSIGIRSVNNVVDITNFCLFELGHPMHLFDFDKISSRKVIIRKAKNGESIIAIDGKKCELDKEMLVIADETCPIAIAGVIGGRDTEVTDKTKNILLEVAYFDPVSIRHTVRKLGISTESSYRFERRVDLENINAASNRAVNLIIESAGGIVGGIVDVYKNKIKKRPITYVLNSAAKLLGVNISDTKITSILTALGCKVSKFKKGRIRVVPASFRQDLETRVDLTEEIARVFGYQRIPETLPKVKAVKTLPKGYDLIIKEYIKDTLSGWGLHEIITYTLCGEKLISCAGDLESAVEIKNPLTIEQRFMRPSLVMPALKTVAYNLNHRNLDIKIFELGTVYQQEDRNKPHEAMQLVIALSGNKFNNWQMHKKEIDFYYLKGMIEGLFYKLGINDFSFTKAAQNKIFNESEAADLLADKQVIGRIGKVGSQLLNALNIEQSVYAAEIEVNKILDKIKLARRFLPLPRYPAVVRDVALITELKVKSQDIIDLIKLTGRGLVNDVRLFDEYHGEQIPAGYRSLAYSIVYQSADKTLKDPEVSEIHQKICCQLSDKLGVEIR